MKTFEEFRKQILDEAEKRHPEHRKGQFIFNYVDYFYGMSNKASVDCFFDDSLIEDFIKSCYDYYSDLNNIPITTIIVWSHSEDVPEMEGFILSRNGSFERVSNLKEFFNPDKHVAWADYMNQFRYYGG